jgi:DNA-binding transcriptional ArsR family regulator
MQDVLYLDRIEQADALFKPRRIEVLRRLTEPSTCTEIGKDLGDSPQKVYYHVKRLQSAGLVELVDERRIRGITEGIYRAVAHSYWVSPDLVGRIGPPREDNQYGLGFLLDLSEGLQSDLAGLAAQEGSPPTLGISGEVRLRGDQGAAFVADLQAAFQGVLDRYSGNEGTPFRLALACYPHKTLNRSDTVR